MFSGILKLLILKGRFPVAALRSIPGNDFFIIATPPVHARIATYRWAGIGMCYQRKDMIDFKARLS